MHFRKQAENLPIPNTTSPVPAVPLQDKIWLVPLGSCSREKTIEAEKGSLRNNGLTFLLIKNKYIYTKLKHKNKKQSTQNTKIRNNPRISPKHKDRKQS